MGFRIKTTETCDAWLEERQKKDRVTWVRILRRIGHLRLGSFGDARSIGDGVSELRLDFGPGSPLFHAARWTGRRAAVWWRQINAGTDIAKAKEIAKGLWSSGIK